MSDVLSFYLSWFAVDTGRNPFLNEFTIFIKFNRGISNNHIAFSCGIDINNLIGNFAVFDDAIRSFKKAVFINTSIGCHIEHQTDVLTFWSLDSTDTTIMRWVGITYIKSGTFTSKTSRPH